jgi:hypothetical protein
MMIVPKTKSDDEGPCKGGRRWLGTAPVAGAVGFESGRGEVAARAHKQISGAGSDRYERAGGAAVIRHGFVVFLALRRHFSRRAASGQEIFSEPGKRSAVSHSRDERDVFIFHSSWSIRAGSGGAFGRAFFGVPCPRPGLLWDIGPQEGNPPLPWGILFKAISVFVWFVPSHPLSTARPTRDLFNTQGSTTNRRAATAQSLRRAFWRPRPHERIMAIVVSARTAG